VILGTRCIADPLRKFGRFLVVPFAVRLELDLPKTAVVSHHRIQNLMRKSTAECGRTPGVRYSAVGSVANPPTPFVRCDSRCIGATRRLMSGFAAAQSANFRFVCPTPWLAFARVLVASPFTFRPRNGRSSRRTKEGLEAYAATMSVVLHLR
jgi:hypothetical protein